MVRLFFTYGIVSWVLSIVFVGLGKLLWGEVTTTAGRVAQGAVAVSPWTIVAGILTKHQVDSKTNAVGRIFSSRKKPEA